MVYNVTVGKLMRAPSMHGSSIIAGFSSIDRAIRRIDILDLPYPEVEQYLEPGEMIMTSFYNSRNCKEARVGLLEAMIRHGCSCLAIMPGICLNGLIDNEIIDLALRNDFPLVNLPITARYSDIISDFWKLELETKEELSFSNKKIHILHQLIIARDKLKQNRNIHNYISTLACLLEMEVILQVGNKYICSSDSLITRYARDSLQFKNTTPCLCNIFPLQLKGYFILKLSTSKFNLGVVFNENDVARVELVSSFQPIMIESLETVMPNHEKVYELTSKAGIFKNPYDSECYLCAIKTNKSVTEVFDICNKLDIKLLDMIPDNRCFVAGIKSEVEDNIYKTFSQVNEQLDAELFVFDTNQAGNFLPNKIERLNFLLRKLPGLRGIFSIVELFLLYMLNTTPFTVRELCLNFLKDIIDIDKLDDDCVDSLRLYIVLNSIKKVGIILGIHYNTVKYRIQKVISSELAIDEANLLNSIPKMNCLLGLELRYIEPELFSYQKLRI